MNEFSHLLESQNSVIITDLLLCISQFLFFFFFTIRFLFSRPHASLTCILRDGCTDRGGSGFLRGVFKKSKHYFKIGIFDFQIENIFIYELCEHSCVSIILGVNLENFPYLRGSKELGGNYNYNSISGTENRGRT